MKRGCQSATTESTDAPKKSGNGRGDANARKFSWSPLAFSIGGAFAQSAFAKSTCEQRREACYSAKRYSHSRAARCDVRYDRCVRAAINLLRISTCLARHWAGDTDVAAISDRQGPGKSRYCRRQCGKSGECENCEESRQAIFTTTVTKTVVVVERPQQNKSEIFAWVQAVVVSAQAFVCGDT